MGEIKTSDISTQPKVEKPSENFDPDKRVDAKNSELEMRKDWSDVKQDGSFNPDKRIDTQTSNLDNSEKFGTSEVYSYNNIPLEGKRGSWEGEKGDSIYVPDENYEGGPPSGKDVKEALDSKGIEGIEYKNGEPDFSEIAEATVEIDDMSEFRYGEDGNFAKADQALADKWNAENHGGRNDWTARDINNYRKDNNLVWHERQDCRHMDLVDRTIHSYFTHTGGVSVCKARNNSEVKFDE